MLRFLRFASALLFVQLIFSDPALLQSQVFFQEDFETGEAMPDQWQQGAAIPGVEYVYDKRQGATGERCLGLQKSAKRYFPIAQWFRTVPYDSDLGGLKLSAQVRAEETTKSILDVSFLDRNGQSLGHEWVSYIGAKNGGDPPVSHDWKEYSNVVAVPKGTTEVVFALQIYGPGKTWFDDVAAEYAKADAKSETVVKAKAKVELKNKVEIKIGKETAEYLGVPAKDGTPPSDGYGLLVVLPGGDGSADFHPFVSNILANSLGDDFVLAQPLARKWTDDQVIVWPTTKLRVKKMGYTTEKLVESVIKDVQSKTKVDSNRIYLLGWSSGGPAVYASLQKKNCPATGGIAAMSVYKPKFLPPADNAKGRSVYILHSPDDRTCPYWMAKNAVESLTKASARVTLVDYEGGHGWHGDVFGNIRSGIDWLEQAPRD